MKHATKPAVWGILVLLCPLACLLSCSTSEPETKLSLQITEQPQGGRIVFAVRTDFKGKLEFKAGEGLFQSSGEPEPITATVEWWWEDVTRENTQVMKTEEITFTTETWTDTSSILVAPFGSILKDYYWVKIHWTDKDANKTPRLIESEKAFCEGY